MATLAEVLAAHRPYGLDCKCGEPINSDHYWAAHLDDAVAAAGLAVQPALSDFDKALIDARFQSEELPRRYGPAGIHAIVQRFIADGLEEARARHDDVCERRDGFRRWCDCSSRRGDVAATEEAS